MYMCSALNQGNTLASSLFSKTLSSPHSANPALVHTNMEFWGVEVKSRERLEVLHDGRMALHLSQASLGILKKPKNEKGNKSVHLFVNVEGNKLVLGRLFTDNLPQQLFDLVFDRNFEISHNWKSGSVYFYGYKFPNPVKRIMAAKHDKPAEAEKVSAAKDKNSDTAMFDEN